MRLRPLTEAECYARCYGGRHDDSVNVLRPEAEPGGAGAGPSEGFDGRLAVEQDGREAA